MYQGYRGNEERCLSRANRGMGKRFPLHVSIVNLFI
jgi:hypothetical protein